MIGSFLRGLSVRDVKPLLVESFGEATVSHSTGERLLETAEVEEVIAV